MTDITQMRVKNGVKNLKIRIEKKAKCKIMVHKIIIINIFWELRKNKTFLL